MQFNEIVGAPVEDNSHHCAQAKNKPEAKAHLWAGKVKPGHKLWSQT